MIPKWLRKCYSLKRIELDNNQITRLDKEDLPKLIIHTSITNNKLEYADISCLNELKII